MAITYLLLTALIPLFTGFIWYNNKVFGKAWMTGAGLTEEQLKGGNMVKIFALTYVLGFLVSVGLMFMVIHQFHFYSILANEPGIKDPNTEVGKMAKEFMEKYGHNFRTFKHGMLHGTMGAIFVAIPVLGINTLFERRSFKYFAVNAGYWIITMMIMGGVICQLLPVAGNS